MSKRIKINPVITSLVILTLSFAPLSCLLPSEPGYAKPPKKPLIEGIYTADPSAHIFDGRIYIYPSHDQDNGSVSSGDSNAFNMVDYHVFSMDSPTSPVTNHGMALHIKNVPWASRQMWAPDATYKNGTYYLYFPARDKKDIFRIGVATSDTPTGPFKAAPSPIEGSYSIDPAVFIDDDNKAYLYFGGLWGGQLENWTTGSFLPNSSGPSASKPALGPRVALLSNDMQAFDGPIREIKIIDNKGAPLKSGATQRFFEGAWMHKYKNKYYLSYSTGDSHFIVYAMGNSPLGPFYFKGAILSPVIGWTTHHSIVEYQKKWYLFYHDASASGGISHQRCVKMAPLKYNSDGTIEPIQPE